MGARAALLGALVCLSACGGEEAPAPAILGDWFACLDAPCGQIGGVGNRFTDAGAFVALYPEGQVLGPQGRYCATSNPGLIYSYSWDGKALRILEGQTVLKRYIFAVEGARAEVINQDSGNMVSMQRLDAPRQSGACRERVPWICPKFDKRDPAAGGCTATWVCDRGTYEVSCDAAGSCACAADGATGKSFSQGGFCALGAAQLSQLYAAVNGGCGWQLSLLPF